MLTDTQIRSLKPGDKSYKRYDQRGLFLEVAKSGSKLWRLRYRFAGKSKLMSLGFYPVVGVAEARRKRDQYLEQIRNGISPAAQRKGRRSAPLRTPRNDHWRPWLGSGTKPSTNTKWSRSRPSVPCAGSSCTCFPNWARRRSRRSSRRISCRCCVRSRRPGADRPEVVQHGLDVFDERTHEVPRSLGLGHGQGRELLAGDVMRAMGGNQGHGDLRWCWAAHRYVRAVPGRGAKENPPALGLRGEG